MRHPCSILAALSLAALAGSAAARNDKLLLPVEPALRSQGTRNLVASDIPLRFGKASAQGLDLSGGSAVVHAVADPYGPFNPYGRTARRGDEQVCVDAFRKALVDLQAKARAAGAVAVVGIVSNYNGVEMDSPVAYECHAGNSRAVVDLKGQFARGFAAASTPVTAPPLAQQAPAASVAAAPEQPRRIASGYAAIDDVDAIPYLSDRGRGEYRNWLQRPTPRAFALSEDGHWYSTSGLKPSDASLPRDPAERALLMCERVAHQPCKLYAVNGAVVWTREPRREGTP
ncbi:MAG TPA: hypothetical protein VF522_20935 [Ramlibacter sp.]|uniref:hypothetical protein n=1 Tax=Ramlibacter sp. TaxID=1917967 RepID=UPI002ED38247